MDIICLLVLKALIFTASSYGRVGILLFSSKYWDCSGQTANQSAVSQYSLCLSLTQSLSNTHTPRTHTLFLQLLTAVNAVPLTSH